MPCSQHDRCVKLGVALARKSRCRLTLGAGCAGAGAWPRRDTEGLVHHSDRGCQYLSVRYTERLAGAAIEASVGSRGDSYDNALAETINGLHKAEVIYQRGSRKNMEAVEYTTLEWVDCFNHRRLLEPIGNVPPAELETAYYRQQQEAAKAT